jgi:cytochrome c-type biogenesis protein CcmH
MRRIASFAVALLVSATAFAVEPGEALKDPALESRARDISSGLRCLVCQNQSIDDSQAALAKDLRLLVRERLTAGDSDEQVKTYLVARYGDFILLKPPVKLETAVLWTAPFGLLALGAIALFVSARRRSGMVETAPDELTEAERARLAAALEDPAAPGASAP